MSSESELKVKITTTADNAGVDSAVQAVKGLDAPLASAAKGQKELGKTGSEAAKDLKELGGETKEMGRLAHEAEGVLLNLERGGISGVARAAVDAGKVIRTLASGTLGAVLIPIVALAGAGLLALRKIAEENERQIKKAFESHARSAELYKSKVAELTAATTKDFDLQLKKIEQIAKAYDQVTAAIDKSYAAQQKLDTAKAGLVSAKTDNAEKVALAAAKTPEQQDAVKQKFAAQRVKDEVTGKFNEFNTVDLHADRDKNNAEEAQQTAREENRRLQAEVQQRKDALDDKKSVADRFKGDTSENGENARKVALAARTDLNEAKKRADEAGEKNSETFAKSQEKIDAANLTKQENAINRDAYRETVKGKQIDEQQAAAIAQKNIGQKNQEQHDTGADLTQDIIALRREQAAHEGTSSLYGNLLAQDAKDRDPEAHRANQRAQAGLVAPTIAGADGKPQGAEGTIIKDGQEIKVTGASTVADLKKVSSTLAETSKDISKATPAVVKAASATGTAIGKYHSEIIGAFGAQTEKINGLAREIEQVKRELQASKDHD